MLPVGLANVWPAPLAALPKPAGLGNGAKLGCMIAVRLTGAAMDNVLVSDERLTGM